MIKVEVEDWVRDKDPDVDSNQRYRTSAPNIMYQVGRAEVLRDIKVAMILQVKIYKCYPVENNILTH